MMPFAITGEITVDVSVALVALVTLTTVLVVGLATLPRPSAATVAWAVAFALGMLGTYVWVAAQELDSAALLVAGSGLMLSFEALIWHGLRLYFGRRPIWWAVVAYVVLAPSVLGLTSGTPVFPLVFRSLFLLAGVFAALNVIELFRRRRAARDIVLPLALASFVFAVVSLVEFITGLDSASQLSAASQLVVLREVNGVGSLLTCVCAAVTIVLLVRAEEPASCDEEKARDRARLRLQKAKAQPDAGWSVLDVRLDDPDELREAWAAASYAQIIDAFHAHIRAALPALADAERVSDRRAIVVIYGSEEAVAHHLRALLARISAPPEPGTLAPSMRVSASVGWVGAAVADYDYDALIALAADAAVRARANGGDRWEHVRQAAPTA